MTSTPPAEPGSPSSRDRWYEKTPGTPLDRFPVLGDAMAAAARVWSESFCALSASPGELAFKALRATTVGDLERLAGATPILAGFRVQSWGSPAALVLGRPLVLAFVEALFGGEGEDDVDSAARPVSPVEMRMVDVIGGQAATALTAGLKEFAPTRFEFDRTRPSADTRFLGKAATPLLAASFELKAIGRTIGFHLVLPASGIEGNAAVWAGSPSTAPSIDDTLWASQLRAEVVRATMALRASIALGPVTLGTIAGWRVGDTIDLPAAADSNVLLTCQDETLFRCDLGQSTGRYTVRIGECLSEDHPPSRKDV